MAVAQPVPRVQQSVFVYPASSDAPATKPLEEQHWITPRLLLAFVIAIVANLAIIITILASSGEPAATAYPQEQAPPAPVALPAPAAAPANLATTFGEGRFVVGTDIAPGRYQTTGPSGHLDCYWERLKNTSDATDSIIANDLGPGPALVTIDKSDAAFQTRWCNTWTKVR
jgi:hypothetical protein